MLRSAVFAFVVLLSPVAARAADLGVSTTVVEDVAVVAPGLWRGHFSGGYNYDPPAQDIALAWTDQTAFFSDDRTCRRWLRDLRAQYRTYEGFHGCLRIR